MTLRRPDFPYYAVVYESLERVSTATFGRTRPIWFFVPILLGGSFPWIVPAIAGFVEAVRRRTARRGAGSRAPLLAISWALMPLVFFSFSQSKLPGYYLPALPGVALGVGLFLAHALRDEAISSAAARSFLISAGVMLVLAATMVLGIPFIGAIPRLATGVREALPGFALVFAGGLAIAAALATLGARRRSIWIGAAALALPVAALPFVGSPLMLAIGRDRSSLDLAAAVERAAPGARVVGVGAYPTSLRYYLDRPVLLATLHGREMTSRYVASRFGEFRRPSGLAAAASRVVAHANSTRARSRPSSWLARARRRRRILATRLPRIAGGGAGGRFVAYGPCGAPSAKATR